MSRFQILPIDASSSVAGIIVGSAADILPVVQRLNYQEADVQRDGDYSFSIRLGDSGAWCIFQRDPEEGESVIAQYP